MTGRKQLVIANTKKDFAFFSFSRIPFVLEGRRSFQGVGVRTPCSLPLDPLLTKLTLKGVGVTQEIPSLVLICDTKTLTPKNEDKLFRTLDCLYIMNGRLTLH